MIVVFSVLLLIQAFCMLRIVYRFRQLEEDLNRIYSEAAALQEGDTNNAG